LRRTLERFIDFDRVNAGMLRLSVGAVNVKSGNFVYFDTTTHTLGPAHVMASGALPPGFPAIKIDGEHYWDGGYTGNPALAPLYLRTTASDVIVVGINPIERAALPQTARGIIDRIDEISFNSTFMLELAAIAFVESLVGSGVQTRGFRSLFLHDISDEALGSLGASSKMNNHPDFLHHLHAMGVRAAHRWLEAHGDAVGKRSTLDLSGLVPPPGGRMTGPAVIREKQELAA
jgi:NTE family protein